MERLTHKAKYEAGYKANRGVLIWECVDKLGQLEDMEEQGSLVKLPCAVGDTVYYRHDGIKIDPMIVEEISISKLSFVLTLRYFGDDESLKYWGIKIEDTAFENKIVFLTKELAEQFLQTLNQK